LIGRDSQVTQTDESPACDSSCDSATVASAASSREAIPARSRSACRSDRRRRLAHRRRADVRVAALLRERGPVAVPLVVRRWGSVGRRHAALPRAQRGHSHGEGPESCG
jgi:hypothetical protein